MEQLNTSRRRSASTLGRGISRFSIRSRLVALILTSLAPLLAFGFLSQYLAYQAQRKAVERQTLELARSLVQEVDADHKARMAALQALALSSELASGNLDAFRPKAQEFLASQPKGSTLGLADETGQLLFALDGLQRSGPLPKRRNMVVLTKVFGSGEPAVSDLFANAITNTYAYTIDVPVKRDGRVLYDLALDPTPASLVELIDRQRFDKSWVATIRDSQGVIVARRPDPERRTGERSLSTPSNAAEGVVETTSLDGVALFSAFSRSEHTGWRAGLGVPRADVTGPIWRATTQLFGAGCFVLAISLALAALLARRIAAPIASLTRFADATNADQPLQPPSATGMSEVDLVAGALYDDVIRRRTAEAALRESEARHRLVIENATDVAIVTLDLEGKILGWNAGAFNIMGWRAEHIIGEAADVIFTPEDRAAGAPEAELGKALKDGRAPDERWHMRQDGSRFFGSGAMFPMRDDSGRVNGFLKLFRDRTLEFKAEAAMRDLAAELERRVHERTLELECANASLIAEAAQRQSAEEQLRQAQKMEVVGRLTGGVAHDFNNLLTIISGSLDLLRRRIVSGADTRVDRLIDHAVEGANRAATLTQRLLAFSRQQPLAPELIDANKLVAGMSELFRRTLGENIAVETVLAGGLWRTHADPNQLENVLLNLAVNARDAMPDGGKLTIETANAHLDETYAAVRAEVVAGQYVMIAICDTGVGMTPQVIAKAFEPFFTTKPVGKGTGLGLSQVYGFAKQSGGHAAIYSEPGLGTTIKVYLPRIMSSNLTSNDAAPIIPMIAEAPARGLTVLVVEDEDGVRAFSVAALEEAGYKVLAADDGPGGLSLLDANPEVKLLFTDVVLKGPLNGRKVADEALRRRPGLKVLFTTGYTRNAIVHHGRLDEGVDLIGKPFTAGALTQKVRRVLEK